METQLQECQGNSVTEAFAFAHSEYSVIKLSFQKSVGSSVAF